MNQFIVKYSKLGKPNGAKRFESIGNNTYEEILFNQLLGELCESNYNTHYFYSMLGFQIFIKRIRANGFICIYQVIFHEFFDQKKFLVEYEVEIETICFDNSYDPLEQEQDLDYRAPIPENEKKHPQLAQWLKEESRAIRNFLIDLDRLGSLKKLRENTSKATYFRNVKICKQKEYIKDNKLIKNVWEC